MNEEEILKKAAQKLLLTKSKAQMINLYLDILEENNQLKSVNSFSKRTLYKINKDRLDANQRLLKENQKLKIEISARETVCNELQERINKASALLKEFYETGNIPLNNISKAYFELNGGSNESQR